MNNGDDSREIDFYYKIVDEVLKHDPEVPAPRKTKYNIQVYTNLASKQYITGDSVKLRLLDPHFMYLATGNDVKKYRHIMQTLVNNMCDNFNYSKGYDREDKYKQIGMAELAYKLIKEGQDGGKNKS